MLINNYVERALSLLAGQFQGTNPDGTPTNFQKLITCFVDQVQALDTANQQLQTQRYLDGAVGVQLDGLGQILGLARQSGQSDASYLEDLKFQAFINQTKGTPEEIIAFSRFQTDATFLEIQEIYPASYIVMSNGTTLPSDLTQFENALQSVSPAGVRCAAFLMETNLPLRLAEITPNGLILSPRSGVLAEYSVTVDPAIVGTLDEAIISQI
jgi:hypothetical protein